jgi:hypothetical protein
MQYKPMGPTVPTASRAAEAGVQMWSMEHAAALTWGTDEQEALAGGRINVDANGEVENVITYGNVC